MRISSPFSNELIAWCSIPRCRDCGNAIGISDHDMLRTRVQKRQFGMYCSRCK